MTGQLRSWGAITVITVICIYVLRLFTARGVPSYNSKLHTKLTVLFPSRPYRYTASCLYTCSYYLGNFFYYFYLSQIICSAMAVPAPPCILYNYIYLWHLSHVYTLYTYTHIHPRWTVTTEKFPWWYPLTNDGKPVIKKYIVGKKTDIVVHVYNIMYLIFVLTNWTNAPIYIIQYMFI